MQQMFYFILSLSVVSVRCSNVLFVPLFFIGSHISKQMYFANILAENGYNVTVMINPLKQDRDHYEKYTRNVTVIMMDIPFGTAVAKPRVPTPFRIIGELYYFSLVYREACRKFYCDYVMRQGVVNTRWDLVILDEVYTSCSTHVAKASTAPLVIMSAAFITPDVLAFPINPAYTQFHLFTTDYQPWSIKWRIKNMVIVKLFKYASPLLQMIQFHTSNNYAALRASTEQAFLESRAIANFQIYPMLLDQSTPRIPTSTYICCDWAVRSTRPNSPYRTVSRTKESVGIILVSFGHFGTPIPIANALFNAMNKMTNYNFIVNGRSQTASNVVDLLAPINRPRSHVRVQMWVAQKSILNDDRTKLFITHGGARSIEEAIGSSVPMLLVPREWDQFVNAVNIENRELGLHASSMNPLDPIEWRSYIRQSVKLGGTRSIQQKFLGVQSGSKYATSHFIWQIKRIVKIGDSFATWSNPVRRNNINSMDENYMALLLRTGVLFCIVVYVTC